MPVTLVLGGTRSGKSRFAESLILAHGDGTYVATAEARDDEMTARIQHHKDLRGAAWHTIDAPLDLADALVTAETIGRPLLVDCLTLWLSNLMEAERDIGRETDALASALASLTIPIVMVSNEVGQGIVPANALARQFRDHAGELNQTMAAQADRVFFVTAGLPAQLK